MSAEAKTQKAKDRDEKIASIKNMEREINDFRQTREKQLQEQAVRMRDGIVKEITDVVMAKVKADNMDLVFDISGVSLNGVPTILFARPDMDFTNEVVAQLNKPSYQSGARKPPPAPPRRSPNEQANLRTKTHAHGVRSFLQKTPPCDLHQLRQEITIRSDVSPAGLFASRRRASDGRAVGLRGTIAIWLGASLSGFAATPAPTPTPTPPAWENTVTTLPRGNFTNPRPFVATYNFGWNGIIAATGEIKFDQRDDRLQSWPTAKPSGSRVRFGDSTCTIARWPTPRRSSQWRCTRSK